jgi:hypothetical protein
MSLATVLDTETGIGYLQNSDMNDSHDLLEKLLKIRFLMTRIKSGQQPISSYRKVTSILKNEKHFHFLKRFP